LLATLKVVNVARLAKVRLEVKIGFGGNSRMKQSPGNTVLALRVDQTYLLQVRLSEVASLYVSDER